jgi:hypothetical protein
MAAAPVEVAGVVSEAQRLDVASAVGTARAATRISPPELGVAVDTMYMGVPGAHVTEVAEPGAPGFVTIRVDPAAETNLPSDPSRRVLVGVSLADS